jgi:hypothetical protein
MSHAGHKIEFLYFDGCPHSPAMRARLEMALAIVGRDPEFAEVDLTALPPDDPRLRFGAPTVLVDGEDLLGHTPRQERALSCRIASRVVARFHAVPPDESLQVAGRSSRGGG